MDLPLVILFCLFLLGTGTFVHLLLTGIIRIKQYTPPEANVAVIGGIISGLCAIAMVLFAIYSPVESVALVCLGVLIVGLIIFVIYRDKKRLRQEGQTTRNTLEPRKLAQRQPQPKEAREE